MNYTITQNLLSDLELRGLQFHLIQINPLQITKLSSTEVMCFTYEREYVKET